jgi:hypothetical protein
LTGNARAKEKRRGSEARAGGKKGKTPRRTSAIQIDHGSSIGLMARRAPCWAAKWRRWPYCEVTAVLMFLNQTCSSGTMALLV